MEISEAKLKANRQNGIKGGEVLKRRADDNYAKNPSHCFGCKTILPRQKKNNKFCSQSCAATHNNKGVRRHGQAPGFCKVCGKPKSSSGRKYCSNECSADDRRFRTNEEKRIRRNEASANYRAKIRNQTPENVDRKAIQEFYANCPKGYEVDHIIPISKGGAHSIDNLQYLTISENRSKGNKILN